MLAVGNITVRRGAATVLRDLSLEARPGEVLAILGPNGAGKSTLLDVLCGTRKPAAGWAALDGQALESWSPAALAARRAVLPQASRLAFPFRVHEVVSLGRSGPGHGHGTVADAAVVEQAMREVGLLHLAARDYTTLSGGERQRVQLARTLAQILPAGPDTATLAGRYLLLDEPTNNLDLAYQHGVLEVTRRLAARGLGVVAVLHDPNLAALYADRIALLRARCGGLFAGTPDEVLQAERLSDAFGLQVYVGRHPQIPRPQVFVAAVPEAAARS